MRCNCTMWGSFKLSKGHACLKCVTGSAFHTCCCICYCGCNFELRYVGGQVSPKCAVRDLTLHKWRIRGWIRLLENIREGVEKKIGQIIFLLYHQIFILMIEMNIRTSMWYDQYVNSQLIVLVLFSCRSELSKLVTFPQGPPREISENFFPLPVKLNILSYTGL